MGDAGAHEEQQWTIDEIARRTGMTVRNIRAHQSRGLVAPPHVRGRTGYYGPQHLARIELIQDLQSEGFNLESIRRIIEVAPTAGGEPLRFLRAAHEPLVAEEPEVVDVQTLTEHWGADAGHLIPRASELGLMRALGDGRFEYPSPGLMRAARELVRLGVPLEAQLEVAATVRRHTSGVAEAYVQLFVERVWAPFEADGSPDERWPEVREALQRLRPLAVDALVSAFSTAMADATAAALGRELGRSRPPTGDS